MSIAEQDPNAAKVARETAGTEKPTALARQEPQPRRGPALPAWPGPLPRRHQAARDAPCGDRPEPACPREDRLHRHLEGRGAPRRRAGRDRQGRRRARRAAAVLRRRPDRAGHDRDREGSPLRRDGRRGDRREQVHRRGRLRADRGDLRAAPGGARPGRRAGGGRPARPRSARDQHRLRAHVLLRRGRQGVRGRRPLRHRRALLAPLDRHADGHERRHRRLRPRHRRRDDPRQLDELHLLPVADRGVAEDPGRQAPARPRRRGRQLRLEVLHAQGADVRRVPLDARRQAGEVRRGPRHAHRQQRPLRLRPALRGVARVRRRRRVQGPADLVRRRLRRLPPVRHRHARQRPVADRRPVPDPARRVLTRRSADEQEPAGRLPRLRRRGLELDPRAARRHGRPRPRPRPGRDPAS